MIRNQQWRVIL